MIDTDEPLDWRALQRWVADILHECGVQTDVEKQISTARGAVVVDVWAHDPTAIPPQTYLIECKQWRARVPKSVVHAFRTVVGDAGAHWGALVSAKGFQRGAQEAARYSNVRLLTWRELQDLFAPRWFERHFVPTVAEGVDRFVQCSEADEPQAGDFRVEYSGANEEDDTVRRVVCVGKEEGALPLTRQESFHNWLVRHGDLLNFVLLYQASRIDSRLRKDLLSPLPLRSNLQQMQRQPLRELPDSILDAASLRKLLVAILSETAAAVEDFERSVWVGRSRGRR